MPQPVLHSGRLVMLPLADEHLELEVQLDADPEVLRYLWGRARSRDEVIASHTERMELGCRIDGLGYWMAFLRAENESSPGEFVGLMMLPPAHGPDQPDDPSVAELGYRILRERWRQGFASEASRELLRHAFETVGARRVIAQTMTVNAGSRAVLEKVGMRYVRTYFPEFDDPVSGSEHGEAEYEMRREDWRSRRDRAGR